MPVGALALTIALDTAFAFVAASTLLALAPGPDNLFVLTQAALHGRAAGILVTLGLITGLVAHTAAVALGVAALIAASPAAFTVLKLAGAGYLLVLAWQAFAAAGVGSAPSPARLGRWALYRRGIIMNVTNPKVSVFFLAFLPQFVDVTRGAVTQQIVLLGALFMLCTLVVFGAIAVFSGMVGERLAGSPPARRLLNRVAGVVLCALAGRLLLSAP